MTLPALKLGDPIRIERDGAGVQEGVVAYLGKVDFAEGNDWVGVHLTGSYAGLGRNDGSVNGVRYFHVRPWNGVFVRLDQIQLRSLTKLEKLRLRRELSKKNETGSVVSSSSTLTPTSSTKNFLHVSFDMSPTGVIDQSVEEFGIHKSESSCSRSKTRAKIDSSKKPRKVETISPTMGTKSTNVETGVKVERDSPSKSSTVDPPSPTATQMRNKLDPPSPKVAVRLTHANVVAYPTSENSTRSQSAPPSRSRSLTRSAAKLKRAFSRTRLDEIRERRLVLQKTYSTRSLQTKNPPEDDKRESGITGADTLLCEKLDQARGMMADLESATGAYKDELQKSERDRNGLAEKNRELEGKLHESLNMCKDLEKRTNSLAVELSDAHGVVNTMKNLATQYKSELDFSHKQRDQLEKRNAALGKELLHSNGQIAVMESLNRRYEKQLEESTRECGTLQKKKSELEVALDEIREQSNVMRRELEQEREMLDILSKTYDGDVRELRQQKMALQKKQDSLENELLESRQCVEEMNQRLRQEQERRVAVSSDLNSTRQELDEIVVELHNLRHQATLMTKIDKTVYNEKDELERELFWAQRKTEMSETEKEDLEIKVDELVYEKYNLLKMNEILRDRVETLKQEKFLTQQ